MDGVVVQSVRIAVGAIVLFGFPVVAGGSSALLAQDVAPAGGERSIERPAPPEFEFTAAERALLDALQRDPSYSRGAAEALTQETAIAEWKRFLRRDDLTKEQRIFAWWRIGSLCAYNFDAGRGETADNEQAERAFAKSRAVLPWLVSFETLNGATVNGSLTGTAKARAARLADAFQWLAARNDADVRRSAPIVNDRGSVLDRKFDPALANRERSSADERKRRLRILLADYREAIVRRITEEIQYSQDPQAIAELLDTIENSADPEQMERWRAMERGLLRGHPSR